MAPIFCLSHILLSALAADALGTASIVNMCNFPMHAWSVAEQPSQMITLSTLTGYAEHYRMKHDGSGISLKFATAPTFNGAPGQNLTQFEYSLSNDSTIVYYDLSKIDGDALESQWLYLQPSDPGCHAVGCAPNSICNDAFYHPDDNYAIHGCPSQANLFLFLCPPNGPSSGSSPYQNFSFAISAQMPPPQPTSQQGNALAPSPPSSVNLSTLVPFAFDVSAWYSTTV